MRFCAPPLLVVAAVALALPARAADQAGVSAAVRGQIALSRAQVAVGRQVVGGEPILLQDAIQSGPRSGMQILLLDETVFTIGPESELVIDEFVYDPSTGVGKVSAEITKGVFRFVTGRVAKQNPQDMNVKLPSGTLGVRGTMVAGRVDPLKQSSILVLLGEGPENDTGSPSSAFEACNAGECVRVNRPGFATIIDGPTSPPSKPFLFPAGDLDKLTQAVSDPEGWVETATSGGATPDVAAGPGDGGDADPRSAAEISGRATANGLTLADLTLGREKRADRVDQLSDDFAQDQTTSENFLAFATTGPTTFDQLVALASTGLQTASYQKDNLPLSSPGGSYDFSLVVNLGSRKADLSVSNLNVESESIFLSGASISRSTSYSPSGAPATFGASNSLNSEGCFNCTGSVSAQIQNGNGRPADAATHQVTIAGPQLEQVVTDTQGSVPIRRP